MVTRKFGPLARLQSSDSKEESLGTSRLTTEGATELIDRAKNAGAKGWLVKPFKPEQLVAAAEKLAS